MTNLEDDIFKSFMYSNWVWRAISKITYWDLKLKDKEVVRPVLTKFVEEGYLDTKPSQRKEDAKGTLKYRLTDKGRSYYENKLRNKRRWV